MSSTVPSTDRSLLPDSELTREEIIARNLATVEAHFHNENAELVDKAVALYSDDISWEAPARGQIYRDAETVKRQYLNIFATSKYHKIIPLRRFATEQFVFDDEVHEVTVVNDTLMPNLPYREGTRMSVRLAHVFEMKDGKIAREIVYEIFREAGSNRDHDVIPEDAEVEYF